MKKTPINKHSRRINGICFSAFVGALLDGPSSVSDLVDATGLQQQTIRRMVKRMHEDGNLYIKEWEKDTNNRFSIAVYAMGRLPNKAKPKPAGQRNRVHVMRIRKHYAQFALPASKPELEPA